MILDLVSSIFLRVCTLATSPCPEFPRNSSSQISPASCVQWANPTTPNSESVPEMNIKEKGLDTANVFMWPRRSSKRVQKLSQKGRQKESRIRVLKNILKCGFAKSYVLYGFGDLESAFVMWQGGGRHVQGASANNTPPPATYRCRGGSAN